MRGGLLPFLVQLYCDSRCVFFLCTVPASRLRSLPAPTPPPPAPSHLQFVEGICEGTTGILALQGLGVQQPPGGVDLLTTAQYVLILAGHNLSGFYTPLGGDPMPLGHMVLPALVGGGGVAPGLLSASEPYIPPGVLRAEGQPA